MHDVGDSRLDDSYNILLFLEIQCEEIQGCYKAQSLLDIVKSWSGKKLTVVKPFETNFHNHQLTVACVTDYIYLKSLPCVIVPLNIPKYIYVPSVFGLRER